MCADGARDAGGALAAPRRRLGVRARGERVCPRVSVSVYYSTLPQPSCSALPENIFPG